MFYYITVLIIHLISLVLIFTLHMRLFWEGVTLFHIGLASVVSVFVLFKIPYLIC